MIALYRFLSVYLPGGPETEAKVGAEVGVGALEMARIGVSVPLSLMGAFGASPMSLFLLVGRRLWQMYGPAI